MPDLSTYSHAQCQRLAFIDFCLEFFGQLSRADLLLQFQTGVASATRDITLYRELACQNLVLRHQTKLYYRTPEFKSLFQHSADSVLLKLAQGSADRLKRLEQPSQYCLDAIRLIKAPAPTVATLLRAISQKQAIRCHYVSLSSGETVKELVPHALANSGHRWHVRCYDRVHKTFRDFVCSRFLHLELIESEIEPHESHNADQCWNRLLPVKLIPHPNLSHTKAIELDYEMQNGVLELEVREALFGYLTQQWHIDCSANYSLSAKQYPLALSNQELLETLTDTSLLPGVSQ